VLHHDARLLALDGTPVRPAHEAVDRRARLRLAHCELVRLAVELVRAPGKPVRPWREHLAPPRQAHLVLGVAVDHAVVAPQTPADLDDDGALIAEPKLVLLARRVHVVRTASPSTISRSTDVSASISTRRARARSAAPSARRRAPSTPCCSPSPSPASTSTT